MPALASRSKRAACTVAMLAIMPLSRAEAADPDYQPQIASPAAFPDARHAIRKEGIFLPPATLRMIVPGLTKHQLYSLAGAPHFHEGFFGEREWNYILNFYTGTGTAYRICRLQLRWDRRMRLASIAWNSEDCRAIVYPPAEKVEDAIRAPGQVSGSEPLSVYFDFDKAQLSEAARDELAALAASASASGHPISVVGYTDSAGPEVHNDRLSLMRADAVAAQLMSLGVSAGRLQISGAGERSPAKILGDGVEEPLNRRVVVSIIPR